MADLMPVLRRQIGSDEIQTVNARDLYEFLELSGDYNLWIKRALKRANLIENIDFIVNYHVVENPKGGRPAIEHHLSFDAAKHIAMMTSADKGHQIRQYFIQKDKELLALQQDPTAILNRHPDLRATADLLLTTAQHRERIEALEREQEESKRQIAQANANAERAMEAKDFYTVAEYVKFNKLEHQLYESDYRPLSEHLQAYCLSKRVPFRRIPIGGKPWKEEYGYHVSVYDEALPGWLSRRFAQEPLKVMHIVKEERS